MSWKRSVLLSYLCGVSVDGFCLTARTTTRSSAIRLGSSGGEQDEPDLFEYFDPLLSPHAYPDGIAPDKKPVETKQTREDSGDDDMPSTSKKKTFGFDLSASGVTPLERRPTQSMGSGQKGAESVDTDTVFDPRISPHEYNNGKTPDQVFGFETDSPVATKVVGILLMDHGSRNAASNDRLRQVARVYQESLNNSDGTIVVRHAHMEIAEPSIPDALKALLDEGVDEIVCHPYFLSPGRHVKQDIPAIVQEAITSLDITIPIVTTEPLGSETDIMIRAIHASVQRTAAFT